MTTVDTSPTLGQGLRWGRIAGGAVLLELALLVAAVPLLGFISNPFAGGEAAATEDSTVFFVTVAALCFVIGAGAGWWVARPLASRLALHGALTGIGATAIYLAVCSIPPTTIPAVFAAYGPFWFLTANGLRIAGATAGAAYGRRQLRSGAASG